MHDVIMSLNSKKGSNDDIPPTVLKSSSILTSEYLSSMFNNDIDNDTFPSILKTTIVHPNHKGDDPTLDKNYRPVCNLLILSKLYEKSMNKYQTTCMTFYHHIYLATPKDLALSTVSLP